MGHVLRTWLVSMTLVVASCGGGDGGLTVGEYAAEAETAIVSMNAKIDASDAVYESRTDPTPEDVRVRWAERVEWRSEVLELLRTEEPPEEAADLHAAAIEVIAELAAAEQAIADRAATAATFEDVAGVEEGELGRALVAADEKAVALCRAAEEALNTDYDPGLVTATPWVPMELQDVVDVAFGCTVEDRRG